MWIIFIFILTFVFVGVWIALIHQQVYKIEVNIYLLCHVKTIMNSGICRVGWKIAPGWWHCWKGSFMPVLLVSKRCALSCCINSMCSSANLITLRNVKVPCMNIVSVIINFDFSSADLFKALNIKVLFCWHCQQRSIWGFIITICGSSYLQYEQRQYIHTNTLELT